MRGNPLICHNTPGDAETPDPAGFERACQRARNLAADLGDGWSGVVWENLGWHYEALSPCGRIDVYPSAVEGYVAMLHEPWGSGMPAYLGEPGRGALPRDAVDALLVSVRERVDHINTLVEGLEVMP